VLRSFAQKAQGVRIVNKVLILGAAGFLGQHLEYRLCAEGAYVVSVARNYPKYRKSVANEFLFLDLTNPLDFHHHWHRHEFDEVFQLAGEVGGVGHICVGDHDADILSRSVTINLNTLKAMQTVGSLAKIFFASSQCVYPDAGFDPYFHERIAPPTACKETDASFNTFPFAQEKLFSEQLYRAYARNHGIKIAIGRFGNTYGPYCTWDGLRAKAPAAICRKVATVPYGGVVELWSATARRSFTYVDDAVDGMIRLMAADYEGPVNIASSEEVSINGLFDTVCVVSGKIMAARVGGGPVGVQSRNSDNTLCRKLLNWEPETSLRDGLAKTYPWIAEQAHKALAKTKGFV
jgi:GDP-D-mannose 3',5'-epimerase